MSQDFQQIIEEYSADYCDFLEAAYGQGMLSEGGEQAVDVLFSNVDIKEKKLLDIGFGTGGAAIYLAGQYAADVYGIEINDDLVKRAVSMVPKELASKLHFTTYQQYPNLPFPDNAFDVVYSKGVLTHVEDKLPLFAEVHRVLKTGGVLVINDWLSPVKNNWSQRIEELCETEGLTLYAETEEGYLDLLNKAGFQVDAIKNETTDYAKYNADIAQKIRDDAVFAKRFGEATTAEAVRCYQLISEAMSASELLVKCFIVRKWLCNKCHPTNGGSDCFL